MPDWFMGFLGSIGVLFVGVVAKQHTARMDRIEEKVLESMDEEKTRQIISDKLDPLRSDYQALNHRMTQIETKIDTLIDMQLRKH